MGRLKQQPDKLGAPGAGRFPGKICKLESSEIAIEMH